MSQRWLPVAVSLGSVVAAYFLYAVTVVPWVEPTAPAVVGGGAPPRRDVPAAGHAPDLTLQRIFADEPDAWELKNPKLLRNEQGILLLDKYKNLGDGKVKIQPCTFVLLPAHAQQDPQRQRPAIILRAPEGAILQFDRDLDIRSGEVGRLLGGVLLGRVTIRSDSKQPGPDDDLYISTFDVKLAGQTITTPHAVDFRWGRNEGRGTELRIDLVPAENRPDALANIGGVQRLTLARDVALRLVLDDDAASPSAAPAAQPAAEPDAQAGEDRTAAPARAAAASRADDPFPLDRRGTLDITCQGRFEYDFVQQTATFYDQVDVVRELPGAPRDHLACQRLTTRFAPDEADRRAASARAGAFARLRLVQLEALGKPAILHAPASQGYARAERMEYVIDSRRITLESQREVQFRYRTNEIRAQQLHYEPGADGRIGRFLATGGGWLTWALQDEALGPPRRMEAHWSRQLFCRPHEGMQVVSIEGQASIHISGQGALRADDIHAWLLEQMPEPPADGATAARPELIPDRMLATAETGGSVEIDSPQLTGRTQRLEVWYQAEPARGLGPAAAASGSAAGTSPVAAPSAAAVRPAAAAVAPAAAVAGAAPDRPSPPAPLRPAPLDDKPNRFDVQGRNVQVQFVRRGEQPPRVAEVLVRGQARLVETRTADASQRPLQVWGDVLHLRDAHTDAAKVTVSGTGGTSPQVAHLEGRGLELEGAVIRMDQGANRVWIDGAGVMTLLVDRDLQGAALTTPQPLRVQWQGRMVFDGTQTTFERSVVASRDKDLCRTETLEIVFAQRVDLSRSSGAARPEVARIYCRDGVYLEGQTYNAQGLESIQQMQAGDLSLNLISGAVLAQGPGWLKRVGLRRSEGQLALTGSPPAGRTSPASSGPAGTPDTAAGQASGPELAYLHVQFQRDLTGNVHRRELTFNDQVKTVYGPIADWQQTLDGQRPDQLGSGAVVIQCQQLTVSQLPAGDGRYWTELQARSNVMVEGQGFTASASVISYSQEKDLLVLEGTDRSSAELWLQKRPGAPRSYTAARKIRYWRATNRIVVDDGRFLDLNQLPGAAPSANDRPPAPPR
jgi:hypothetical protein